MGRPFVERGPLGAAVVGVDEPHVVEAHEPEDRGVQVVALKASESLATGAVPLVQLPATLHVPLVVVELHVRVAWAWPTTAHVEATRAHASGKSRGTARFTVSRSTGFMESPFPSRTQLLIHHHFQNLRQPSPARY